MDIYCRGDFLGTSRTNEPLQAVIENQLNPTALQETNNSVLERNRALLQYVATIANSNSASDKFNYEFVESLVKGGADINIADHFGQSIFHEVARSWDCDVAQFLLDIGKALPEFVMLFFINMHLKYT
jgi:ankyrin repeat protein